MMTTLLLSKKETRTINTKDISPKENYKLPEKINLQIMRLICMINL